MNHVRIVGDPFAESAASSQLRSFVRQALGAGLQVSLSLAAVTPRPPAAGERSIALTDGVRDFVVGTMLPPAEIELLLRAAGQAVAATAPLLVFAEADQLSELVQTAGWQWPLACVVLPARAGVTALEWIDRVRAELRWAGCEHPPHAREERELSPWLSLPLAAGDGPFVAVGGTEFGAGIELVIESWCRHFAAAGPGLRLVLPRADAEVVDRWRQRLLPYGDRVEILLSPFEPAHARSAAAVVLPWRRCHEIKPRLEPNEAHEDTLSIGEAPVDLPKHQVLSLSLPYSSLLSARPQWSNWMTDHSPVQTVTSTSRLDFS